MSLTLQDFVNENGDVSLEDISQSDQERINDALADLTADPGGPVKRSPIAISDWNDLADIENDLSADYVLINDLDSSTDGYSDFSPISGVFRGSFDGQGNTIHDLDINGSSRFIGLFRIVAGTIENLNFDNADVDSSTTFLGVLAGNFAGTAQNVAVTNSNVTGEG